MGKGCGGVWEMSVHNGYILYRWSDALFYNLWRLEFKGHKVFLSFRLY